MKYRKRYYWFKMNPKITFIMLGIIGSIIAYKIISATINLILKIVIVVLIIVVIILTIKYQGIPIIMLK